MPKVKNAPERSPQPLSEYLSVSRAWLNDAGLSTARLTEMRLPKSAKDPMVVRFREPSNLGAVGRNEIAMDATGSVVGLRRIAAETAGVPVMTNATVTSLYANADGTVRGVSIQRPDGSGERVGCGGVELFELDGWDVAE